MARYKLPNDPTGAASAFPLLDREFDDSSSIEMVKLLKMPTDAIISRMKDLGESL